MTERPLDEFEQDDPVEILRILPTDYRKQFLAEYQAAVDRARRPEALVAAYYYRTSIRSYRAASILKAHAKP